MYSVVLLMSMQAVPAVLPGHRRAAGCTGVVAVVPVQQSHGCTGGSAGGVPFVSTPLPQVTLMAVPVASRRGKGYRSCAPGQICAIGE